ncbi:hypothetical protein AA313_de0201897 [Arthrobotrys entomopaga]|nr:hypothetical protein AA313_de0201897 [Arthrobotrys entomopaga]
MLNAPKEEVLATVTKFYSYPIIAKAEKSAFAHPSYVTFFPQLLETLWARARETLEKSTYERDTQRIFKCANGEYKKKVAPWNQPAPFDITASIWDDERLASWGYFHGTYPTVEGETYRMTISNLVCIEDCDFLDCPGVQATDEKEGTMGCGWSLVSKPLHMEPWNAFDLDRFVQEMCLRMLDKIKLDYRALRSMSDNLDKNA